MTVSRFTAALGALSLLLMAGSWAVLRGTHLAEGLPLLGEVPAFSLTDSRAEEVRSSNLRGAPWVADFIFTSCPGTCPAMSGQMARLQRALVDRGLTDVRSVSFSVDPANDSPEVLREYAQRFGADPKRWLFVTGERDSLHRLIKDGFKLAVAERSPEENTDGAGLITHSDRFVLIDAAGHMRGYYHGTDPEDVDRLLADIQTLHAEDGRS
jgi:protein SCO1/2